MCPPYNALGAGKILKATPYSTSAGCFGGSNDLKQGDFQMDHKAGVEEFGYKQELKRAF